MAMAMLLVAATAATTAMAIPDWQQLARSDPKAFRARLLIDTGNGPVLFVNCMEPWQDADFSALDAGWAKSAGAKMPDGLEVVLRAYLERPRGHSKTTDIATMASWTIFAADRKIFGVVAAADRDQARLIRDAIDGMKRNNSWLDPYLKIHNYEIHNPHTGSKIEILASDAATNYGLTPDFVIADELTHWLKQSTQDNWETLFSSAAKRPNCMVVIISNAGIGEGASWQWRVREHARTSPDWHFSRIDGPHASWITEKQLVEQQGILSTSAYKRLWLNQWVSGAGDALEPSDVDAAFTLPGPLGGRLRYEGHVHLAGLDLGVKHDHAALVVLAAQPGSGRVKLAHCQSWKPPTGGEIDLQAVRDATDEVARRYSTAAVYYDPHQCKLLAQELAAPTALRPGLRMEEMPFVGNRLNEMASVLLQAFRSRKVDLYHDEDLKRDLLRLSIVEKSYGYKLESVSDEYGHADRAIALAIVLPMALEVAEYRSGPIGDSLGGLTRLPGVG